MGKQQSLGEIAAEIHQFLKKFEADPAINTEGSGRMKNHKFWHPNAYSTGKRIAICDISYQGPIFFTRPQALAYLEWLKAGGKGSIWDWERTLPPHYDIRWSAIGNEKEKENKKGE